MPFDHVKTSQSQAVIIVLGDFNRTEIRSLCLSNGLTQVVNKPTREDAILDLLITDFSSLYSTPHVTSLVGKSDHNCVIWLPKISKLPNTKIVKKVQPISDSKLSMFGRWIQIQEWT